MLQSSYLFKNARIFQSLGTKNEQYSHHTTLFVENNTIVKLGSYQECSSLITDNTTIIDCKDNTLTAGLIDAHNHITLLGASLRAPKFNYPDVACTEDVLNVVKKAISQRKAGEWIRGWGLDYGKFPHAKAPTRFELDTVSPHNPVAIVHYTGHYVLVNSKALELANIDDSIQDPDGGRFLRDEQGRLNGIAQDAAQQMVIPTSVNVKHHGPDIGYVTPIDELVADIKYASEALLSVGVTAVLDPQVTTREMAGLVRAKNTQNLGVRTIGMVLSNHLEAQLELGIFEMFGDDMLSIGPIKYYCDGAIVGGSAAFTDPLKNRSDGYNGSLYWEKKEDLEASLKLTHSKGLQFGIHTQGDRAHEIMLGCVDNILHEFPRKDHRHRIEHSGYPLPEQVKKIAKLGMLPITQPGQLREAGRNLLDNYGEERATRIYPLREFLDNNIKAVISSDAFVQSYNPMSSIYGAVERTSDEGYDLGKSQRISMPEAIVCHTRNAAFSFFWEDKIGSLEEGKLADIVLFDCDLLEQKERNILDAKVNLTMLDGKVVYQS